MRAHALLGAFALLVTGCSTYSIDMPKAPPVDARAAVRPSAAEVCVVRQSSAGGTQVVRDNGHLVGATMGMGYFCYGAIPGLHRVVSQVGAESGTLDLALSVGERVFLQQSYTHEEAQIAPMPEREARAAMASLHYQRLVDAPEPVLDPATLATAAADLPKSPPTPPASAPERRPTGMAYGVAAGLGLGSSRIAPATHTTANLAALGSIWAGASIRDFAVLALRVDASLVNGATVADVALHLSIFPAANRPSPARDFMIFADGGLRPPSAGAPLAGVGRLGVGWEPWRLGPVALGLFLDGQVARGAGEADAAVIGGLGASLYPRAPKR